MAYIKSLAFRVLSISSSLGIATLVGCSSSTSPTAAATAGGTLSASLSQLVAMTQNASASDFSFFGQGMRALGPTEFFKSLKSTLPNGEMVIAGMHFPDLATHGLTNLDMFSSHPDLWERYVADVTAPLPAGNVSQNLQSALESIHGSLTQGASLALASVGCDALKQIKTGAHYASGVLIGGGGAHEIYQHQATKARLQQAIANPPRVSTATPPTPAQEATQSQASSAGTQDNAPSSSGSAAQETEAATPLASSLEVDGSGAEQAASAIRQGLEEPAGFAPQLGRYIFVAGALVYVVDGATQAYYGADCVTPPVD